MLTTNNRKIGAAAEYSVPATRYQHLRLSHCRSCKSTLWVVIVSHMKTWARVPSSHLPTPSAPPSLTGHQPIALLERRTPTSYRLAGAAYFAEPIQCRNGKLARQYGIESPHDTTVSDTVALSVGEFSDVSTLTG
ncbi:hypothetical protein TARUN_8146 [Trichoderma arundinaceum]|uniref:Uncharacterized protein n=1 Tax=Trichoderma arundinaceum TaxID=490622 RepID=A0A395NE45_TRIAR|nr:hypothetical protein TARUN_8146 [Trichoderma arundinaceum]